MKSVMQEAHELVYGDRAAKYGSATEMFSSVAQAFQGISGYELSAADIVTIMMLVKMVRQNYRNNRDNLVDLAGYAGVMAMVMEEEQGEQGCLHNYAGSSVLGVTICTHCGDIRGH